MSVVGSLKVEHDTLMAHLLANEPSLAVSTGQVLSKSLLLAGASELEVDIIKIVVDFFDEVSQGNASAIQFVENKALKRQYHTLFAWEKSNANQFFSLFGPDMKQHVTDALKADASLGDAITGFLSLGLLRNQLVHGNFASFSLSQTADEVYKLYLKACAFRDALPALLRHQLHPTASQDPPDGPIPTVEFGYQA